MKKLLYFCKIKELFVIKKMNMVKKELQAESLSSHPLIRHCWHYNIYKKKDMANSYKEKFVNFLTKEGKKVKAYRLLAKVGIFVQQKLKQELFHEVKEESSFIFNSNKKVIQKLRNRYIIVKPIEEKEKNSTLHFLKRKEKKLNTTNSEKRLSMSKITAKVSVIPLAEYCTDFSLKVDRANKKTKKNLNRLNFHFSTIATFANYAQKKSYWNRKRQKLFSKKAKLLEIQTHSIAKPSKVMRLNTSEKNLEVTPYIKVTKSFLFSQKKEKSLNEAKELYISRKKKKINFLSKKEQLVSRCLLNKQNDKKLPSFNQFLLQAINNVKPTLEVRKVRIRRTTHLVPAIVHKKRQEALAMKWIISFARQRKRSLGRTFIHSLANELIDAYKNQGQACQKRDDFHKLAAANRASLRYRWW